MAITVSHSLGCTGTTDNRPTFTSAMSLSATLFLISGSATGLLSFCTAFTSTMNHVGVSAFDAAS